MPTVVSGELDSKCKCILPSRGARNKFAVRRTVHLATLQAVSEVRRAAGDISSVSVITDPRPHDFRAIGVGAGGAGDGV